MVPLGVSVCVDVVVFLLHLVSFGSQSLLYTKFFPQKLLKIYCDVDEDENGWRSNMIFFFAAAAADDDVVVTVAPVRFFKHRAHTIFILAIILEILLCAYEANTQNNKNEKRFK